MKHSPFSPHSRQATRHHPSLYRSVLRMPHSASGDDGHVESSNHSHHSPAGKIRELASWWRRAEPVRIAGPIHYVGTQGLGAYLMTTPKGHLLLDGSTPNTAWMVEQAIRKLGYRPEEIRYLLVSHAHFDHAGSAAHFKRLSGAKVIVMRGDEEILKSGGRTDFLFGRIPFLHFPRVTPDRVLEDGDEVEAGGLRFTALHTPGHTRGCTTWMTRIEDGGKSYGVVFPGSTSVNPGTRFTRRPSYPGIAEDYRKSLERLAGLRPDIFLCSHASFFDFDRKRELARTKGAEAYVDPEGYRRYMEAERREFEGKVRD